jgi:ATP-binding cassette subfamily B protein
MIAKHYGLSLNIQRLRDASGFSREGVSLLGIAEAAESVGFRTIAVKVPFDKLVNDAPCPCIIHWQQNHFVVLVEVQKNVVLLADPVPPQPTMFAFFKLYLSFLRPIN